MDRLPPVWDVASAPHESTPAQFGGTYGMACSSPPPDYFDPHFSYPQGPADLGGAMPVTHPLLPTTTSTATTTATARASSTKDHKPLLLDGQCANSPGIGAVLDSFDVPLNDMLFESELHGLGLGLPARPADNSTHHPDAESGFDYGFEPLPPYEDAVPPAPCSKSQYSCAPTPPQAARATRASPAPCPADDKRSARRKKNRGYQQASRSRKAAMLAEIEQQKFLMRYFALSVRQLVHKDLIGGAYDLNQFCKDLLELELRCGLDLEPGSAA